MDDTTEQRVSRLLDRLVHDGAPGALARLEEGDRCWTASGGVARLDAPDPVAPEGWFLGYNAWSFHTQKAACQLTISATASGVRALSTLDIVTAAFGKRVRERSPGA